MIVNTHMRRLPVMASEARQALGALGSSSDRVWPTDQWPALRLSRGLEPGSHGGHGPIGYAVESVTERSIVFRFTNAAGLRGTHRFDIEPDGLACIVRHTIEARAGARGRWRWAGAIRPLHNALIEDLLDNLTVAVGAPVRRPARWSAHARVARYLMAGRRQAAPASARRQQRSRNVIQHDVEVVMVGS